ncbi:hypothetical protein E4T39_07448 [Aureobasidium subglaciale]|nr:hypothetical protein E4T39_07448 [Aureobasidium subglaciale]
MVVWLAASWPTAGVGPFRRTLKSGSHRLVPLKIIVEVIDHTLNEPTSSFSARKASAISMETMELAVVGAHLSGFPLNKDITSLNATFQQSTTTSPNYRLFELQGAIPAKPGLMRVSCNGACVDIEIWAIPVSAIGTFLSTVPSPLGLGTIEIDGERWIKGFICEPYGLEGAKDITEYGGWKKYKESS